MKLYKIGLVAALLAVSSLSYADTKISGLPAGAPLTGVEEVPAVQSGATVKTTSAAISTYVESQLTSADIRGLWTGTCNVTTFLRGDGACASVIPTPAALTRVDDTNVTMTLGGAPATALLNATSLTLGWNGQLSVARGGTGAGTLTGYLIGNGTGAFTASATIPYANLTGTPTIPGAADPTGVVGLTAVNGVASTYLRSDGAPALDQAIAPTMTGAWTYSNAVPITISNAQPRFRLNESDQTTDEKLWVWDVNAKLMSFGTRNDADSTGANVFTVTRGTGTAISNMSFGSSSSNNTFTYNGTGTTTFTGGITVTSTGGINAVRFNATGNTVPTNGMYLPGTNRTGFSTNATYRGEWDASGRLIIDNTAPAEVWQENDQGTDLKSWIADASAGVWSLRTVTDALGTGVNALSITRGATTAISNIDFGNATNNPTYNFLGTGIMSFSGDITMPGGTKSLTTARVVVTGSTLPANGIYRPVSNVLGLASNTTLGAQLDSVGQFALTRVGAGLSIKEGTNAKMGVSTLVAGTVVVSTTAVTATSRIQLTPQNLGTVVLPSACGVSARTAGTSFTILCSQATDTSDVAWLIVEPSP